MCKNLDKTGRKSKKGSSKARRRGCKAGQTQKSRQNTGNRKRVKATKGTRQAGADTSNTKDRKADAQLVGKGADRRGTDSVQAERQRGRGKIGGGQPFPPTVAPAK